MGDERKTPATDHDDSAIDSVEEALVGSHQEPPSSGDGRRDSAKDDEDGPPVPGNQTP